MKVTSEDCFDFKLKFNLQKRKNLQIDWRFMILFFIRKYNKEKMFEVRLATIQEVIQKNIKLDLSVQFNL